uniref:NADH-ubiquinone oxidoreductase chain 1 n=1 Tax=Euciroa cf. queenslandica STW-2017 TaxID=1969321 RepID=A0A1U9XPF3_9BIVA|nr:NADH dehydrogenase subunit 1 [Euciroa cf. queenslandica STW-2017]AQZ26123.1 NADH dehydrogenase subunit 1 [Euciroa cf. queenslandica STW-2017]
MWLELMSFLITYIFCLLSVAYFTLFERKVLAYSQKRKGPNKVGYWGFFQPFADAIKLFTKELTVPSKSNWVPFILAPILSLGLSLMLWHVYPNFNSIYYVSWGLLYFLCVSSVNVYGVLLAGWSSNSKYALLGSLRGAAQTISYEVSMALILLFSMYMYQTLSVEELSTNPMWFMLLSPPLFIMFVASAMAETNRAPFDLVEGESELVSGFNVEYGGPGFALIFMGEYANIIFMSSLVSVLWCGGFNLLGFSSVWILVIKTMVLMYFFVWARATLPRFRYDLLMSLTWKYFLPISLSMLMLIVVYMYMFM